MYIGQEKPTMVSSFRFVEQIQNEVNKLNGFASGKTIHNQNICEILKIRICLIHSDDRISKAILML